MSVECWYSVKSEGGEGMATQVLYVGRGDDSLQSVWPQLRDKGYAVTVLSTQRSALEAVAATKPDVILVDGTTPRLSVTRLCRRLKHRSPGSAIVLLTHLDDRYEGKHSDVRLAKPFTWRMLLHSIENALEARAAQILEVGPLRLDLGSRRVWGDNGIKRLTPRESQLLAVFMRRPGEIISRRELMQKVWNTDFVGDTRTLDVHIRWL
ncbi:MAG TPA: response regulator transcription factor, partial [Anaerolineae bacterium]|nr:response regulator transcription factor [Anaerolineae bacterium]